MVETRAQHRKRVTWNKVESAGDVFRGILSRLSVRSIRSVKTVNRYWRVSVCNKSFATQQLALSRKKQPSSYIACPSVDDKAMKLYLLKPGTGKKFNFRHHATVRSADYHRMHMISSFNGLVCCINQLSDECEEDYQIRICNPSTEETLLLPQGRPSLWTEPSIGVAYGPDISDYKIFRIFAVGEKNASNGEEDLVYECEVYSSSTGAWRSIGSVLHLPMYACFSPHRSGHVFAGGKIYWLVSLEDPGLILSVDMEDRFGVIELPHYSTNLREEDSITVGSTFLINLGGSLSLVVLHADYFDIWVWKEASWILEVRDDFPYLDAELVLFVTSSEKEILCVTESHLWTYHLNIRKWKRRGKPPTRFTNPAMFPYTESLLPCNGGMRLEGR